MELLKVQIHESDIHAPALATQGRSKLSVLRKHNLTVLEQFRGIKLSFS